MKRERTPAFVAGLGITPEICKANFKKAAADMEAIEKKYTGVFPEGVANRYAAANRRLRKWNTYHWDLTGEWL